MNVNWDLMKVAGVLFGVAVAIVLYCRLVRGNVKLFPRLRFWLVFWIRPEEYWKTSGRIVQSRVSDTLSRFAYCFYRLCGDQNELMELYDKGTKKKGEKANSDLRVYKELERGIRKAERKFWYAHELAKRFKYAEYEGMYSYAPDSTIAQAERKRKKLLEEILEEI